MLVGSLEEVPAAKDVLPGGAEAPSPSSDLPGWYLSGQASLARSADGTAAPADGADPAPVEEAAPTGAVIPADEEVPAVSPPSVTEEHGKSSRAAGALSVVATAAGWAMLIGGAYLSDKDNDLGSPLVLVGMVGVACGPSAGHYYAGDYRHARIMAAVRVGGMALFSLAAALAISDMGGCGLRGDCGDDPLPPTLFWTGLGVIGVTTVYDWIDAPFAVERVAERSRESRVAAVPGVLRATDGAQGFGLMMAGRF